MKTILSFILLLLLTGLLSPLSFSVEKEKKDTRPFCKTVDEAAKWVLAELPREETLQIAHYHEEGLIHLHFSLGMWIRNNVPVWGNEPLLKSVGTNVHPDTVGGMILHKYWLLARSQLPENERKRMEYFEKTLPGLKGSKPTGETHDSVIRELNSQIKNAWPKDAPYPPYLLVADKETYFTWEPKEMGEDLNANVKRFLGYHRSISFYDGDCLRVGVPDKKKSPDNPDAGDGK